MAISSAARSPPVGRCSASLELPEMMRETTHESKHRGLFELSMRLDAMR